MRPHLLLSAFAAAVVIAPGCSSKEDEAPAPTPVLSVKTFDVTEAGFGDAPVAVHFVWSIESNVGKPLTCKLDLDGDGAFEKEVQDCKADTTSDPTDGLPTFTFDAVGEHDPRISVTDGERTVEASTKVFANKITYGKNTIRPEQTSGFVKADVTPMTRVVLTYDSAASLPTIHVGDILLGTSGSGYLLKASAVTTSGATITVDGSAAQIQDAIENGFFGARDIQAPMKDAKCLSEECAGLSLIPITDGSGLSTKSIGKRSDAYTIKGEGSFGLKVPLPSAEGIEQSMFVGVAVKEFVLEIGFFKLKKATLDLRPSFQYEANIVKELASKEWRLGEISLGTIPVGPLIITPVILPTVRVAASLKFGVTYGLNLPVAIKYEDGWKAEMVPKLSAAIADALDPNTASASMSAELTFIPKVDFLILGIAGPYVGPTATLSIEGKLQTAPSSDLEKCGFPYQLCFAAKVGAGGEYGAELPWIDSEKASIKQSFTLAEASVWQKCFGKPDEAGNCPAEGPNVDASPPTDGGTTDETGSPDADDAGCPTSGPPERPECAKCEHDLCVDGTALAPTCNACSAKVCAADEYCCTQKWTLSCQQKAQDLCGAPCGL